MSMWLYLKWQPLTAGCPCCLMSIWAKEQVSPTPTTSTVKFLKKSMISRDFLLREKIKMMGVTTGLISSSRINTWKGNRGERFKLNSTLQGSANTSDHILDLWFIRWNVVNSFCLKSWFKMPPAGSVDTKRDSLPQNPNCTFRCFYIATIIFLINYTHQLHHQAEGRMDQFMAS